MGMILAKFRKKKKSNSDLLETIDKEITSIENFQRNTEQQRKRIVGQFLIGSVGIYLLSAILFYFYFYPQNFKERLLYLVPFILAPAFIFFMKRALSCYFNRKLHKNQKKMVDLCAEKKMILENIMETETYKVARALLEKYAPDQVRRVNVVQEFKTPIKSAISNTSLIHSNQGLRNRLAPNSRTSLKSNVAQTPTVPAMQLVSQQQSLPGSSQTPFNRSPISTVAPRTLMPGYIPSKDRTFLDKVVDYLIGEGPNNRYALICKQCAGHNGMALIDEFEYVSFKCCYCMAMNPARKMRATAPKLQLESPAALPERLPSSPDAKRVETSESEKNSGSDTDDALPVKATPTLETLFRKQVANVGVGNDEGAAEANVSSDNEPNDFDKLSDLENRDLEEEVEEEKEVVGTNAHSLPSDDPKD